MNGRVYDPKLGRFLQADPFIQEADNTQSYNRYSYVINNPLNATDPSGFIFSKIKDAFKSLAGAITAIAVTAFCQACAPALIGALSGAVGAAATGGNILKGAAFGALSGAAFGAIGDKFSQASGFFAEGGLAHIGAHALTGGAISALQGGKFITGFAAAGLAKAANVNRIMRGETDPLARSTRIFTAAIVGGTASEITGGKFANGATTAALAQAVNGESAQTREHNRQAGANILAATKEMEQVLTAGQNPSELTSSRYWAGLRAGFSPKIFGAKLIVDVNAISHECSVGTQCTGNELTQGFTLGFSFKGNQFNILAANRFSEDSINFTEWDIDFFESIGRSGVSVNRSPLSVGVGGGFLIGGDAEFDLGGFFKEHVFGTGHSGARRRIDENP